MEMDGLRRIEAIFKELGRDLPDKGILEVTSPMDGAVIAQLAVDNPTSLAVKVERAKTAQRQWGETPQPMRVWLLEALAREIRAQRELLAEIIMLEAGKTWKEALAETDSSADVLLKTIKDASYDDVGVMQRRKERPPVGIVGLITSFNFPLVVAYWTMAPALLSGNAVLWKPSEKTPLCALALKPLFDKVAGVYADLLHVLIGRREMGEALVRQEAVDMISATGSVMMGQGIKAVLAQKKNHDVPPILELGGNNGVIISHKMSGSHLEWSLRAVLHSFLGTTGQRCTNTRRIIAHRSVYDRTVELLTRHVADFLASGVMHPRKAYEKAASDPWQEYGYGALIDADAYRRFELAKYEALKAGGRVVFGNRLWERHSTEAYYVEPAIVPMPGQPSALHEEVFAPLLYIVPYDGDLSAALALLNAPANAGLTNGIYTQSQAEANEFARLNKAGHGVINSPKGTGTPAYGMGFGGNKASGEGEILNSADPLRPFTRPAAIYRVAQNKEIAMDWAER